MLTSDQIAFFHENGYLNVGIRFYTEKQAAELRERLNAVMEGRTATAPEALRNLRGGTLDSDQVVVQIVNIWEADDLFLAHLVHPEITASIAQLTGAETIRVWHDQIQYKPPITGSATDWHQDYPAWPILDPADLISCWVALDDATLENGCMRMVPGSHKWGAHRGLGTAEGFAPRYDPEQLPPGAKVEAMPCEVKAGCGMFHHCLTWHGSPPNPSRKPRPAIAVHYMPGYTRYVPKGRHLIDHRVEVQPGEILQGAYFPTVRENGRPIPPDAIKLPEGPPPVPEEFMELEEQG
jgi:ectoine hydroxylase-related dioxygenase (phytanoyl-CoA dioxygenase family)